MDSRAVTVGSGVGQPIGIDRAALLVIRDRRDLPFVWLIGTITLTVLPLAAVTMFDRRLFWPAAALYLALDVGVLHLPTLVMYHDVAHRQLFKPRYRFLRHYLNWVIGPLFGMFPNGYFAHHVVMHHAHNNLGEDLSSTMSYQRDSARDFLRYVCRWMVGAYGRLAPYLRQRGRRRLARGVVVGEAAYFGVIAVAAWFNWQGALVVFGIPFIAANIGFCAINWAEHAFVDRAHPDNIYCSAITCVNTLYNRLAFNDGYHASHHLKPHLHWTEMPAEFSAHRETYARQGAIVFDGVSYLPILLLLLTRQYRALARHCISDRSEDDIIATLRSRTAKFAGQPARSS
jgi:fatty acid desaturase